MNKVFTEEVLNKAYRLAYFLHQDKRMAIRIVAAATLRLNVAMAAQSKRLYYTPVGRFSRGESRRTDGIRNKTLFSDLHLLQRLLYVESEPYERQKERAAQVAPPGVHAVGDPASEEDLLVYFVKHLVRITTKRNAFYVTLGVSRLLHSYSTLETMEIYNAVIGEPERVKDDYYYRSRKAVLMHEMYQRFGQLIRASRQRWGEERFETQEGSSELRSLVRECLRVFTPWDTQCPVPRDFDPLKAVIASLTSKTGAGENEIEVNRIHAILHPDCFEKLIAAFGYSSPAERMELPRFFLDQMNDQPPPRQRSAPAELSAEELAEINHMLDDQAGRRRRSSPTTVLRILVDGVERARLNPAKQSSISFSAEEDAEIIEVKTTDPHGDLLLATHLLTSVGDAHNVSSIRLEGGQELSLTITRRLSEANRPADLLVSFGYHETAPLRAARLWLQRRSLRRSHEQRILWGGPISARHIVVAGVLVVICIAGFLGYVRLRSPQTNESAQISSVQPTPSSISESRAEVIKPPETEAPVRTTQPNRTTSKPPQRVGSATPNINGPAQTRDDDVGEATRSGNVVANLTLREVKKIYLDIRGDAAFDDFHSNLVDSFNSSGIVAAATNADNADAALKIVISKTTPADIQAAAQLVNARGTVLWSSRHSGEHSKVTSEIVKDLLSEIRRARAGH